MATVTWEHLPDSGAPQVGVTVSGVTGTQVVTVEVSWDGGATWHGVRGARRVLVTESAFFRDFVPPLNVPVRYRAVLGDGSVAVSSPFQPGQILRHNLVTDPRATSGARWSQTWGTGGAGTKTMIAGASDGPVLPDGTQVTTYARYTITTPNTAGHPVFGSNVSGVVGSSTHSAGTPAGVALYIRPSRTITNTRVRMEQASGGTVQPAVVSTGHAGDIEAGAWTRLDAVLSTSVDADTLGARIQLQNWITVAGDTIDVTCGLAEPDATEVGPYFDGDTAPSAAGIPAWEGARNASPSVLREALDRVASDCAWLQDPLAPRGALPVATFVDGPGRVRLMAGSAEQVSRSLVVDYATVQGARLPVASIGTRQAPAGVPLVLRPLLDLAADQGVLVKAIRDLIDAAGQVVIRGLPDVIGLDPVAHVVAPGVVEQPSVGRVLGYQEWQMSLTQVRPQALTVVVPWWTYADVAAIVQAALGGDVTYADVLAAMPSGTTYLDALREPRVLIGGA